MINAETEIGAEINLEEVDNFLDEDDDFVKIVPKRLRTQSFGSKTKLVEVDSGEVNTPMSNDEIDNLHYKLKNQSEEHTIRQVDGKMECPFCKAEIKNVNIHFQRKPECGGKIDMVHFSNNFEDYKKRSERIRKNKEMQKLREKQKKYRKQKNHNTTPQNAQTDNNCATYKRYWLCSERLYSRARLEARRFALETLPR